MIPSITTGRYLAKFSTKVMVEILRKLNRRKAQPDKEYMKNQQLTS